MNPVKGLIYGVVSSSTFGLIPLFALPVLGKGMGVDSVMFYRFGISALILGIWLAVRQRPLKVTFKELITLTGLGILYALTALLLTTSYLYIPSGVATTIHFLYPVVVTAMMIVFFHDRISMPLIIAAFMAISGVYLLSYSGSTGEIGFKGLLLVLTTVITYAVYIVGVNKSCVHRMDGLILTFYILLIGTVVFGLNLLVKGIALQIIPDWHTGVYLFLLATIPTLVSDFTLILSVKQVGSTTTAILGCMEPLTAVAMGVLFLEEQIGLSQSLGILIILLAVSTVILANSGEGVRLKKLIPLRSRKG